MLAAVSAGVAASSACVGLWVKQTRRRGAAPPVLLRGCPALTDALSPSGGACCLLLRSGDLSGLVRALVRHVRAQVGLDMSSLPPEAFTHCVDIKYSRSGAKSPDTVIAAADAIAAGAQPPPPAAAKSAAEAAAAAAVAAVTAEDSLSGLRVLDGQDPACHTYEQVNKRVTCWQGGLDGSSVCYLQGVEVHVPAWCTWTFGWHKTDVCRKHV